jgi:L-lactate dehydrogenase complex protein LldG
MHVVLVDNGRSARLGMERFWHSLKCIRCAACMNTCPVYRRICSAVPECKGTIRPAELSHWSEASKIDVSIVGLPIGVAETGSVLLSVQELHVNTIAFLSHDLVVLLDPTQIVRNIHDVYRHPYFKTRPYSLLMTGPSGSADIGGVTVHPAQGVKTLTTVLMRDPKRR